MNTHYIHGQWRQGTGKPFYSADSSTGTSVWNGNEAASTEVDAAVGAARIAFPLWSAFDLPLRTRYIEAFRDVLTQRKEDIARAISIEVGKPLWESKTEVAAIINKVSYSIDANSQRCADTVLLQPQGRLATRHRPHGVMAVFGPFNFPGHLPHGHIIPALLAGNTIVFKPSELTPLVAETLIKCWEQTGLPPGIINLIQGGRETGGLLAAHRDIDGLLFTGSWPTGKRLSEQLASAPYKILALEMGGNNPYVIGTIKDIRTAAYLTIQSAFLTSGQRCTCARRLIIPRGDLGDRLLETLVAMAKGLAVGAYTDSPEPFMGPVISSTAAERILNAQKSMLENGGLPLLKLEQHHRGPAFLSPGIIDVTSIAKRADEEIFGPLLQVIRVDGFAAAINEANNTQYGLAAGLLSDDPKEYEIFLRDIRAGVVNWNVPLTGASSAAPFGGIKHSGNHRPSAFYSADYCAYPVASLEAESMNMPAVLPPGMTL